jgi:hypothetical protein
MLKGVPAGEEMSGVRTPERALIPNPPRMISR